MKFSRSVLLTLAAVGLVAGCGKSGNPTNVAPALDTTPPPVPESLAMAMDDPMPGAQALRWRPSSAPDVARYEVFVYAPDPSRENSFVFLGESVSAAPSYLLEPVGTRTTEFYRVRAVDHAGNRSALSPTLTAERQPITLSPGGTPSTPPLGRMHE